MTIERIVKQAIPLSDCPLKKKNELWRREQLTKRIEELCRFIQNGQSLDLNLTELKGEGASDVK